MSGDVFELPIFKCVSLPMFIDVYQLRNGLILLFSVFFFFFPFGISGNILVHVMLLMSVSKISIFHKQV